MGKVGLLIVLLLTVLSGYLISRVVNVINPPLTLETPETGDGWWGHGLPEVSGSKPDTSVREFRVNVSDAVLEDLRSRLENARFVDRVEDAAFNYGFDSDYTKQVQRYWLDKYSWRDAEKRLNQFDQFVTNIEGIDVHFIHAKPKLAAGQKAKPLIMVHGWPGSVYEFYKILPMLTDPTSHGGSADDTFEVICPSIPGYGFSEAPHKQGFDVNAAARVFHKLMQRIGLEQYYVQGGDWGSFISTNMAIMFPDHVKGVHVNWVTQFNTYTLVVYPMLAQLWPSFLMPDQRDQERVFPVGPCLLRLLHETGYMHLQATKPQTVAQGVNDSPIGLAAYILEKFSTWTNPEYRDLADGGLTRKFSLDDLLTDVMIYWVNGNIASSMRFYKESLGGKSVRHDQNHANKVPMGYASFPNEFFHSPECVVRRFNPNMVHYSYQPIGGHFAALEEPGLLAEDIRQFVRKVEAL